MQFFMGGARVVGRLSAYVCGLTLRQWKELRSLAERNVTHATSWAGTDPTRKTDGFVSFEEVQIECMDVWKRGVVQGVYPHPNSIRARLNRFWLWITRRSDR